MATNSFYTMFVDLLKDTFDAENQIVEALPKVIQSAAHEDLKIALSEHLEETRHQVERLKNIFKILNENPTGTRCRAMQGILEEGKEVLTKHFSSAAQDAALIIACQKVEHYEIAAYGSLRSLAKHLDEAKNSHIDFSEIADLLDETLEEEKDADEKLTEVAEGGFFTKGINDEAQLNSSDKPTKGKKSS